MPKWLKFGFTTKKVPKWIVVAADEETWYWQEISVLYFNVSKYYKSGCWLKIQMWLLDEKE